MKKIIVSICICLMLAISCASAAVLQPTDDFYVLDDANVLDIDTEGMIVFSNDVLFADCGAQIVVVVADTLGGEDIADYAYEMYNDWAIGNKDGEGMLILLAVREENYYVLCGEGLEDDFSAGTLRSLCNVYIEPDFEKGDYDAAVDKVFRYVFGEVAEACGSNATINEGIKLYEAYMAGDGGGDYVGGEPGFIGSFEHEEKLGGSGMGILWIVVILLIIAIMVSRSRRSAPRRTVNRTFTRVVPPIINVINTHRPRMHTPPPGPGHNPGGHFGSRPAGGGSIFGNSRGAAPRSTFGGMRSSFGSSRSTGRSTFGGSRSGGATRSASRSTSRSGFGGSRSGGGGRSRGGGAGRGR